MGKRGLSLDTVTHWRGSGGQPVLSTSDWIQLALAAAAVVTLGYVAIQTRTVKASLLALERSAKVDAYLSLRSSLQEINALLINDADLAERFGFDRAQLLGFITTNYCELMFLLHTSGLIDDVAWEAQRTLIGKLVKRMFVRDIWQDHRDELHPAFVEFVENSWRST